MGEKLIEKNLRDGVKKLGGLALKLLAPWFTGWPDRTVLMPMGRVWFVELKSTGKKASPRQVIVHALLRKIGFEIWLIDTQELVDNFLKHIQK